MKARIGGKWRKLIDYDYQERVLIQVSKWVVLESNPITYFRYRPSLKLVWNYRSIGIRNILRKIYSRMHNDKVAKKFLSCGFGTVLHSPKGSDYHVGDAVVFLATHHPEGLTRIALESSFLHPISDPAREVTQWGYANSSLDSTTKLSAFDINSGKEHPSIDFDALQDIVKNATFLEALLDSSYPDSVSLPVKKQKNKDKSITILGWGHHSRTIIAPSIPSQYRIRRIHDIDPSVLLSAPRSIYRDSKGTLGKNDNSKIVIISSYHHHHAQHLKDALLHNKSVICEKPLTTTREQLDALIPILREHPRVILAYQKRFDIFFSYIQRDLNLEAYAIHYRCTVHEVSLPLGHWYTWPNSGSRIISNGCHWIDHFLALKPGISIRHLSAKNLNNGNIEAKITLVDESTFEMLLSDHGSDEKGNRENIRIDCDNAYIEIENFENYHYQNKNGDIIDEFTLKLEVYPRMYARIFERIEVNDFDSIEELIRIQKVITELNAMLLE